MTRCCYVAHDSVCSHRIGVYSDNCNPRSYLWWSHGDSWWWICHRDVVKHGTKNTCSYKINCHPNRRILEREGWPYLSWPIFDGAYIKLDDGLVLISWCCVDCYSCIVGVGLNRLKLTIHHDGLDFESSPLIQAICFEGGLHESGCLCIGDMLRCPKTDVSGDGHKKIAPRWQK